MNDESETSSEGEVDLTDFQQGFLAGWIHAQGWGSSPNFEQFSAAAVAFEEWMGSQQATKQ